MSINEKQITIGTKNYKYIWSNAKKYISRVSDGQLFTDVIAELTDETEYIESSVDLDRSKFTIGIDDVVGLTDIITKDHILTEAESKGFALLGSSVTKTDYPNFYDMILKEYQDETNTAYNEYVKSNITVYPGCKGFIDGKGKISGFWYYSTKSDWPPVGCYVPDKLLTFNSSTCSKWEFVTKINTGEERDLRGPIVGSGEPEEETKNWLLYITDYNNVQLYASHDGETWDISDGSSSENVLEKDTDYAIKVLWSGTQYKIQVAKWKDSGTLSWATWVTVDNNTRVSGKGKTLLGFNSLESFKHRFIDLNHTYATINGNTVWSGTETVELKKNINGRIFYNAETDKDKIDTLFNSGYNAYYYGIDETNETIYLPRLNERKVVDKKLPTTNEYSWYTLYSDGWCEQGGQFFKSQDWYQLRVYLLKPYKDDSYVINTALSYGDTLGQPCVYMKQKDYFQIINVFNQQGYADWECAGYTDIIQPQEYKYMVVGTQASGTELII